MYVSHAAGHSITVFAQKDCHLKYEKLLAEYMWFQLIITE